MNTALRYDTDPAGTVAGALRFLPPDCDRVAWVLLGMAVKAALGEAGLAVWDAWSQGGKSYRAKDAQTAWKSFKADGRVSAGTLFHLAKQAGWAADGNRLPTIPPPHTPAETEAAERALRRQHQAAARLAFGKLVLPVFADPKHLVNLCHRPRRQQALSPGRAESWLLLVDRPAIHRNRMPGGRLRHRRQHPRSHRAPLLHRLRRGQPLRRGGSRTRPASASPHRGMRRS